MSYPSIGEDVPVKLVLVAAAALLDAEGRVLIAERPPGKPMAGLWEFPGGKVESGEAPEATLQRELAEELGIAVEPEDLAPLTFASHGYADFHLLMPLYLCRRWSGEPRPLEGQRIRWTDPAGLHGVPMPEADIPLIAPLVSARDALRPL